MNRHETSRRGLATLELTIAFPFFVLMIALIVVTADGMVLTNRTVVDARTNAFKQALTHRSAAGMDRFVLEPAAVSGKYKRDIVTGSANNSDDAIPVFGSPNLTSSAEIAVLRNTWSYAELPLDDGNRLKLYGQVALAGGLGEATSLIDQLTGLPGSIASTVEGLGQASNATQQEPAGLNDARNKQQEARKKAAEEKKKKEDNVKRLEGEIKQLNDEITQLRKDREQAEKDLKDKPEELEAKQKMIDEQIDQKEQQKKPKETELAKERKDLDYINKNSNF